MTSYTTRDLAEEFSVSMRTVRFYEERGLLRSTGVGNSGKKRYSAEDRSRLQSSIRAKRLGMNLTEVEHLIHAYGSEGRTRGQLLGNLDLLRMYKTMLIGRRADIDATLKELHIFAKKCEMQLDELNRPACGEPGSLSD